MIRMSDVKDIVSSALIDTEFEHVVIYEGPGLPDLPNAFILVTETTGPGLNTEGIIDVSAWQVRVVGHQGDYGMAEEVATLVDNVLRHNGTKVLAGVNIVSSKRVGGRPYALEVDNAERTHFVCTYLIETKAN